MLQWHPRLFALVTALSLLAAALAYAYGPINFNWE